MEKDELPMFSKTILALMELHGKQASESLLDLYWEALRHLSASEFKAAISKVVRTEKFMPKPAEILDAVSGRIGQQKIANLPVA